MTRQIIGTSHALTFRYTASGKTHSQRSYVNAVASGDSTGFDLTNVLTGNTPLSTAITQWAALFSPLLGTGATAAGVTLYQYVGSSLVPVYQGAWTFTSSSGSPNLGWEVTWFLRGGSNFPLKIVLLEANYGVLQHSTSYASADIGTAAHAMIADVLDTASGHLGAWMHTLNGHYGFRFIAETVTTNRRVRRSRGLT